MVTGPTRDGGPDFIGVGAQKCGTSWIGHVLRQHPGVLFSRKEVNFFVRHFHRGYGWYHRWFADRGARKAGEITPNYLYSPRPDRSRLQFYPRWSPRDLLLFWRRHPSARDEIFESYGPTVRVFAIFRNPVDRAWSHYWFWRNRKERIGKASRVRPFRTMFDDDGRWIRTQGFFGRLVAHWRERFPDLGVFLYDDLRTDPLALARAIYRFVGVDDSFVPEFEKKVNKGEYPPMPAEERAFVADVYRDDVRAFSKLVGRDLSHWLGDAR